MGKGLFTLFVPPVAVYRYGCAGYCAAPIGVFWIAGIASLVYSLEGGPVGDHKTNWVISRARHRPVGYRQCLDLDGHRAGAKGSGRCEREKQAWCRVMRAQWNETDLFARLKK